jgi:hypothetical protein
MIVHGFIYKEIIPINFASSIYNKKDVSFSGQFDLY